MIPRCAVKLPLEAVTAQKGVLIFLPHNPIGALFLASIFRRAYCCIPLGALLLACIFRRACCFIPPGFVISEHIEASVLFHPAGFVISEHIQASVMFNPARLCYQRAYLSERPFLMPSCSEVDGDCPKEPNTVLTEVCMPVCHSEQGRNWAAPFPIGMWCETPDLFAVKHTNTYLRHGTWGQAEAEERRVGMQMLDTRACVENPSTLVRTLLLSLI